MGLDQFAYYIDNNGKREEIACWRKHPNLQGWMESRWEMKGRPGDREEDSIMGDMGDFNCIPLELNHDDLDDLEYAITNSKLPETDGFLFGTDSDDEYKAQDLEFIQKAREALDGGLTVCYDSWW